MADTKTETIPKCSFSELTLPTEKSYVPIAQSYAGQVARAMGFDERDVHAIEEAVHEAAYNVVEHAFQPDERADFTISCERVPTGIGIVVKDRGIPWNSANIDSRTPDGPVETGFQKMRRLMDEVRILGLGDGKEVHLTKHLTTKTVEDYLDACELRIFDSPPKVHPSSSARARFNVRLMQPHEAVQVAKAVYRAYRYTYAYDQIYYPDRMAHLNEAGRIISAVAFSESGAFAGHCSIFNIDEQARVAEIGQAVVQPEFRGMGCLVDLTQFLIKEGRTRGLVGMYVRAVTNHTFSQRVAERLGFKSCGMILGYAPQNVTFRGITETLRQRETFTMEFQYLENQHSLTLYVPEHHRSIVKQLYASMGVDVVFQMPDNRNFRHESEPHIAIEAADSMPPGFAKIAVREYGSNVVQLVAARLRELRFSQYDVIALEISMMAPETHVMTAEFEKLGFFFSGIVPGKNTLMLQYFNNVQLDYSLIKIHSKIGREILSYVEAHDPNSKESDESGRLSLFQSPDA
jgi:serine/threonine-protein kinase RsbW